MSRQERVPGDACNYNRSGLDALMEDRTTVIVAHPLSAEKNAGRIVVLDSGASMEEGSHEKLITRGGRYAEPYNTSFRHRSLEYIESFGKD